jgi:hypothetical protein
MPDIFDHRGKFLRILIRVRGEGRILVSLSFAPTLSARTYQDHQKNSAVDMGRVLLDRPPVPSAAAVRARRADRWRCDGQKGQKGRMGPHMSDVGADEISFLLTTERLAKADACDRRAVGCAIAQLADAARQR